MEKTMTTIENIFPECFVSCFYAGEQWRKQVKFAVQFLFIYPKRDVAIVTFSTN
jgi:hypothetical protein